MLSKIGNFPLIAYVIFSKGNVAINSESHLPILGLATSLQEVAITT